MEVDVWRLRPLEPSDAARSGLAEVWGGSGADGHTVGAFDGTELLAGARLAPIRRTRRAHCGHVELTGRDAGALELVLDAIVRFTDRWTSLDRLELEVAADEPAADVAPTAGFEREGVFADRHAAGRDGLGFGRLRPGFVPRTPGPPPPWPERGPRVEATFSAPTADDVAALARLSVEPTTVWGTLQTPTSNLQYYANRHQGTDPAWILRCARVDGVVAGQGSVSPGPLPGVWSLGMMVGFPFQGRGVGGALLDDLVRQAWGAGVRRLELGVWADNHRAAALYRSRGFVEEGRARFDGLRDGGHATTVTMALRRPAGA